MDIAPLPMSVQTAQRVDYWADRGDTYRAIAQFIKDEGYVKSVPLDALPPVGNPAPDPETVVEAVTAERNRIAALLRDAATGSTSKTTQKALLEVASIIAQE